MDDQVDGESCSADCLLLAVGEETRAHLAVTTVRRKIGAHRSMSHGNEASYQWFWMMTLDGFYSARLQIET